MRRGQSHCSLNRRVEILRFFFSLMMDTKCRMESTGLRNRIQLSQATADLLIKAGKQSWIVKRSDEVEAKGKGRMQTYWLKCSVSFPLTKPTMKSEDINEKPGEQTISESDEASIKARGKETSERVFPGQRSSSTLGDETSSTTEARGQEEDFE